MTTTNQNLIIPINVQALCIGSPDTTQNQFIKPTADFSLLPYKDADGHDIHKKANISEYILANPFGDDQISRKKGIHLHWTLPDVLTHSQDGIESFPTVPNRWLITRIQNINSTPTFTSWVVESDYLATESLDEQYPYITVPYQYKDNGDKKGYGGTEQPYRYMGKVTPLADWSPSDPSATYYDSLTAIGYGELTFSACYSNCSSVFGLYDKLDGIDTSTNLSYVVTGWYADSSNDFLNQAKDNLADWLTEQKWYLQDQTTQISSIDPNQSCSLYSGLVKNINWNASQGYLQNPDFDNAPDPDKTQIAFAPTNIEALSAFFVQYVQQQAQQQQQDPDPKINEQLLNALQLGMLSQLNKTGASFNIDQALNAKRFQHKNGGTLYTIVQTNTNTNTPTQAINLPEKIATSLNDLNQTQQQYDQTQTAIQTLQWQIFVDWYKYMVQMYDQESQSTSVDANDIESFIKAEIGSDTTTNPSLSTLNNSLTTLQQQCDTQHQDLVNQLHDLSSNDTTFKLKSTPAPRYYAPTDPVVLLASSTDWSYAGERNKTENGQLLCRTTSQVLTGASALSPDVPSLSFSQDLATLINEALLLSQGQTGTGTPPETIANQTWNNDPFLPLTLQWQVEYEHLTRAANDQYASNHITDNFTFDQEDELAYKVTNPSFDTGEVPSYDGTLLLTPSARFNLVEKIQEDITNMPDDDPNKAELHKILNQIQDLPILSQSLNGFQNLLLMQKKTLQLQVYDPYDSWHAFSNNTVYTAVDDQNATAPQPQLPFNPIQDGCTRITQLRLVDAFGRYVEFKENSDALAGLIYPKTATTFSADAGTADWLKLYTRINQPTRLSFRFLSAKDNTQEMNSHPASTPICGWVMHNMLDYSLMFYDQDGSPIGAFKPGTTQGGEAITWQSAPGVYDFGTSLADCFNSKNTHLYALAQAVQQNGLDYLQALLQTIDTTLNTIAPQGYAASIANPLFIGRPLALVQTFVQLALQGLPAANESWSAFSNDIENTDTPLQRTRNNFTQVQIPLKLGDHTNFQDGIVGYFSSQKDSTTQIDYTTFHTTTSDVTAHDHIVPDNTVLLRPYSLLDAANANSDKTLGQNMAMLIDPRAQLHAITGILPVKSIQIPEDQYVEALKSIYVTFQTTPVLADMNQNQPIAIPVSVENGKKWSWVELQKNEKGKYEWSEKDIPKAPGQNLFKNPIQAYEGWLKLTLQKSPK